MTRTTEEWIGKTDDTPVPPHVRLRVFERFGGICCECTVKIDGRKRWVCDHRKAIVNGGENRESNLGPIHEACDRQIKTPADVAEKKINNRVRSKHLGIKQRKGRPMPGSRDSKFKRKIGGGWERR